MPKPYTHMHSNQQGTKQKQKNSIAIAWNTKAQIPVTHFTNLYNVLFNTHTHIDIYIYINIYIYIIVTRNTQIK